MRTLCLVFVVACAGGLMAQNQPPTAIVRSIGVTIPNGGGVNVVADSFVNGAQFSYEVNDPDNDPVGVSASITGTGQFINWNQADFNHASSGTPWTHTIVTNQGQFGSAGEVYNVSLEFSDGTNTTTVNFTINVITAPPGGTGGGGGGGGGGGCAIAAPAAPVALVGLGGVALLRRRRKAA